MKMTAIVQDGLIIVDGVVKNVPFVANGEWAVQFNGFTAEIEYTDSRPNEQISEAEFLQRYQYLLDGHAEKVAADLAAEAEAEAEALAAAEGGAV
jgi:hypothetical protein